MKSSSSNRITSSGYSLIEIILCVGVLTIMVSIAMASFSAADGVAQAKDQRNAQSLCTLFSSADAAGVRLIHDGVTKLQLLRVLKNGITVESGPFRGKIFSLPGITDEDIQAAA